MRLYLLCAFYCISSIAFSQNNKRLTNNEYLEMRDKIKALTNSNTDSALIYAERLERSADFAHKAFALGAKSYLLQYNGDSVASKKAGKLAFEYLKKVPNGFEKTKLNSYLLNYNGLAEWKRGNLKKALQSYTQGKRQSQNIGDIIQQIKFNNNISSIYSDAKNYRLAIKVARESDKLTDLNVHQYEKDKYNQSKTTVSYKLGSFYENEFFIKEHDKFLLDSALYYYKKTLVYSDYTATNNATAQLNIGNIYSYKGDLKHAEKMYLGLLKPDKYNLTDDNFKYLNVNLGILYFKQEKYKEALICFQKVDSAHFSNNNSPAAFYYSNYYQAKVYNLLKNNSEALRHSRIFLKYYDKAESKLLEEIIDVNFIIGKEAAAKEILEIEKSNEKIVFLKRLLMGILIIGVVFLIVFLLWKNNQKRKDNQKAMLLIEEFKRQIEDNKSNPEVLFVSKKENITIDEEKENEIIKKLQELENKKIFLNQDYTQQFVAKKIKTNTTYLSYVVNKRFGKSFSEYANELKINYVINQLITNPTYRKYSTQAIAESAGFKKANSFTLSFKKRTGLTPVQFAEKIESEYNV